MKRDEHAARRDVALAVSAAVVGFASAAAPPLPPGPRDDDAPITLPDAKPAVVLARAALQLAEARLDEPRSGIIRVGYLRRVARRKKPPYRFHRIEVRRKPGAVAVLASAPSTRVTRRAVTTVLSIPVEIVWSTLHCPELSNTTNSLPAN